MSLPVLSIITATRNAAAVLPGLLDSLAVQTSRAFELIIQDGASTDATLEIVSRYMESLPTVSMVSETDSGLYDAWNRAVPRMRGEWALFVGADDVLLSPDSVKQTVACLTAQSAHILYVAAPVRVWNPHGGEALHTPTHHPARDMHQGMALPHQGLFHRRSLFIGQQFDTQYRIAADYAFVARTLRPLEGQCPLAWMERPVVGMRLGGVSSQLDSLWRVDWEQWRIARQEYPHRWPWKTGLRLGRSLICAGLVCLLGPQRGQRAAACFADGLRRLTGKPRLWTR